MLKKIGFSLLLVAASVSTNVYSVTINHQLQLGMSIEFNLPPNDPQLFTNYMFWAVDANCRISTEDESDALFAEATNKKGKINNVALNKGDSALVIVHDGDNLKLSADSGAQVRITNQGEHMVKAVCNS